MKYPSFCLLALLASSPLQAADDAVPVHEEPRHRLLFDAGAVRVLELYIPPGDTTQYHVHSSPIFYITIKGGAIRMQRAGGDWVTPPPREGVVTGEVRTTESYADEPVTHRVNNISDDTIRSILILNEKDAPAAAATIGLPGESGIDSKWFRQSRIELDGGQSIDWPGGDSNVFFVLATDTHVTLAHPASRQKFGMTWTGNFTPVPQGFPLRITNRSEEKAVLIAVAPL